MRHILLTLFLLFPGTALAIAVGEPAPEFVAQNTYGQPVTLSALKGKPVILEWHNPECPFVKKHYGAANMQQMQRIAKDAGFTWITVNSGAVGKQGQMTDEQANEYVKAQQASPAHYVNDPSGTIGKAYDAKTTPHMFVIDAEGKLVYMGAIDSKPTADPNDIPAATNYVAQAISAILGGKTPEVTATQAYGCAVKYSN